MPVISRKVIPRHNVPGTGLDWIFRSRCSAMRFKCIDSQSTSCIFVSAMLASVPQHIRVGVKLLSCGEAADCCLTRLNQRAVGEDQYELKSPWPESSYGAVVVWSSSCPVTTAQLSGETRDAWHMVPRDCAVCLRTVPNLWTR